MHQHDFFKPLKSSLASMLAEPSKDGSAFKDTYHDLDDNEPDHNPLQSRCVAVVLMVSQHVEHFSKHLRARRREKCQTLRPPSNVPDRPLYAYNGPKTLPR